jgi:hypothetical protein
MAKQVNIKACYVDENKFSSVINSMLTENYEVLMQYNTELSPPYTKKLQDFKQHLQYTPGKDLRGAIFFLIEAAGTCIPCEQVHKIFARKGDNILFN